MNQTIGADSHSSSGNYEICTTAGKERSFFFFFLSFGLIIGVQRQM